MSNPNTPTAPDEGAGVISGDYTILKLALEHAEAECARLRGLIAAQPCQWHGCSRNDNVSGEELCFVCKAKEAANG